MESSQSGTSAYESFLAFLTASASGDGETVRRLISRGITGFGAGKDETVLTFEQAIRLIEREQAQGPDKMRVKSDLLTASQISDSLTLIMALVSHEIPFGGTRKTCGPARYSALLKWEDGGWKIFHLHISEPWAAQEEGEAHSIGQMDERNRQLNEAVAKKTGELRAAMESLEKMAATDKLTGAFNRHKFEEIVERELLNANRRQTSISMIMLDLDHFKKVNDDYGHLKGDLVLSQVVQLIRLNLRDMDMLVRWGGEEFILLLPGRTSREAALAAQRIRRLVFQEDFGIQMKISISAGVGQYHAGETFDAWLARTDQLMYQAKQKGRNQVAWEEEP